MNFILSHEVAEYKEVAIRGCFFFIVSLCREDNDLLIVSPEGRDLDELQVTLFTLDVFYLRKSASFVIVLIFYMNHGLILGSMRQG
ncbi:MAG: hypothetical protein K0A99_06075 [Desulfoarculaceae bacterium]|nr:hypothetical protein [Desulfoarculaceae bacterium]